jgi:hypothetical protein
MEYRGFIVWGVGIVVVLAAFLIFVAAGWPGSPDACTNIDPQTGVQMPPENPGDPPDTCYCEQFSVSAIFHNDGGVRQPVNTWFNLYAIFTSLLVAWQVWRDRQRNTGENPMKRATNWLPDVYIFAVLFLGLGSMWFHAGMTTGTDWMDGFSMYVFAGFLVFYSIYRYSTTSGYTLGVIPRGVFFAIFYPVTVALYTIIGQLLDNTFPHAPVSALMILSLVIVYLVFEILIAVRQTPWSQFSTGKIVYMAACWLGGLFAFGFAFLFWKLSQTGGPLCDPTSFFQPHGLFWHPLAGIMAVLLFYYWREGDDRYAPTDI